MATVTPPLRPIAEPSTPRHGPKYDSHEPYLRRRSSRLKSLRTPSPGAVDKINKHTTHRPQAFQHNLSPPSSPISPNDQSPRRRSRRDMQPVLADGNLVPKPAERMLPTPIKTPSKKDTKRATKPASRVLFAHGLNNSIEDVVPRRRRVLGYNPVSTPAVEVYTDTNARVPELDETEENVFYDAPHRRSGRAKTRVKEMEATEEKRKDLEQDRELDKGMWFTFRGKKVWREYEADDQDDYPEGANMTGIPRTRKVTPPPRFTKTAYKPRTLFPEAYKKGDTTDEEAVTDIENPERHGAVDLELNLDKTNATPVKQRFYATPPTTARTTRSTATRPTEDTSSGVDELSTSLFTVKKGKRTSPFNEWSRVKGDDGAVVQEKKRKANQSLDPGDSKRVRADVSD